MSFTPCRRLLGAVPRRPRTAEGSTAEASVAWAHPPPRHLLPPAPRRARTLPTRARNRNIPDRTESRDRIRRRRGVGRARVPLPVTAPQRASNAAPRPRAPSTQSQRRSRVAGPRRSLVASPRAARTFAGYSAKMKGRRDGNETNTPSSAMNTLARSPLSSISSISSSISSISSAGSISDRTWRHRVRARSPRHQSQSLYAGVTDTCRTSRVRGTRRGSPGMLPREWREDERAHLGVRGVSGEVLEEVLDPTLRN